MSGPNMLSKPESAPYSISLATEIDNSSQVCDSPRPYGRLATIAYHKGEQSLQAVVSLFKRTDMAVFPSPDRVPPSPSPRCLMVPYNVWWLLFSLVPFFCMIAAFGKLMGDPKQFVVLGTIVFLGGYIIHFIVLFYVFYWYRDMPFQLIGAKTKFMIEVIPLITAATLHHFLAFNYAYIALLVSIGCTGYFYTFAYLLHVAYDISVDVLLGLVMQVLGYMLNVQLLVRALVLSFCLGFSFYRYVTYCAPKVPAHRKKESELLPC